MSGGRRPSPLDVSLRDGVKTLRTILTAELERTGRSDADLIFGRTASEPFTPTLVRRRALAAWEAENSKREEKAKEDDTKPSLLETFVLHEARHSYSTYLDAAGISETRADRYMGHANPSVANRYRHQLEGQLAEDAARLEEFLIGAAAGKVVQIETGAQTGAQRAKKA